MPYPRLAGLAIAMAALLPVSTAAAVKRLPPISIATRTPIKHVIIVVMENRTFDNVFNGFPGADSVRTGKTHLGKTVDLVPTPFEGNCDPNHSHEAWVSDYDRGKMDGFDTTPPSCTPNVVINPLDPGETEAQYPYGYLPYVEVKPYWDLAKQFAVADRMFASQSGPSYPGHLFIVAGTSDNETDDPSDDLVWGCDSAAGTTVPYLGANGQIAGTQFPCLYKQETMGNLLDRFGISWAYYSNNLSYKVTGQEYDISTQPYDAFALVREGPDWQPDVVEHEGAGDEFRDIYDGHLPTVAWFNPPVIASDHAQATTNYGPDYVAQIADALMMSPAGYWKNTALFVLWDDHGGWYDHVVPQQLDNNGLGFRVPLIAAGAYVKRGYVSHVRHEYGSTLKFIEYNWKLPSLETTDRRADNLLDLFDFSGGVASRKPVPIAISHPGATLNFFETLPFDTKPLDYTPEEK